MEARERLGRLIDPHSFIPYVGDGSSDDVWASDMVAQSKADALRKADSILKALNLTDAAALALMDGEGVVVPEAVSDPMYKRGLDAAVTSGSVQRIWDAMLDASPYKETTDDA